MYNSRSCLSATFLGHAFLNFVSYLSRCVCATGPPFTYLLWISSSCNALRACPLVLSVLGLSKGGPYIYLPQLIRQPTFIEVIYPQYLLFLGTSHGFMEVVHCAIVSNVCLRRCVRSYRRSSSFVSIFSTFWPPALCTNNRFRSTF